MVNTHLFSVFFAPRGSVRMYQLGNDIAQQYLTPSDLLIGVIGEAGSGKSMIIKGMFPGLELTNDDEGVNVRPLPLFDLDGGGFFKPHTYHIDIRFELAFSEIFEIVDAIKAAIEAKKRVIVEHFELIFPHLGRNANLLVGVGAEIIVTRPTLFGPKPQDIADSVLHSIVYRKMAHSAEDLVELSLPSEVESLMTHGDVRHGFLINFPTKPEIDIEKLEEDVNKLIAQDLSISYIDDKHVKIGDTVHLCTGPRTHVASTGKIKGFRLIKEIMYDQHTKQHCLVGLVGEDTHNARHEINRIML